MQLHIKRAYSSATPTSLKYDSNVNFKELSNITAFSSKRRTTPSNISVLKTTLAEAPVNERGQTSVTSSSRK
ncbi:hypothetical protein Q8A67_019968 [Cirrhinus molitorella]|uniref:Uncharacterized protein n=1 Tax=Cirrhinus molitorella TaxID=172907 RepID=A0AA88TIG2_9TELE|nr:hypothetical protein Q8A67_019968 [Cirrhinus molitorella]